MVDFLESVIKGAIKFEANLKICFSCRHYPLIALEGLTVCLKDENAEDISAFVQHRLQTASLPADQMNQISSSITSNARGVFQWVAIVVPKVLTDIRARRSTKDICSRIKQLSSDLDDHYESILSNFRSDDEPLECANLMKWICFAVRPPSLIELRHALILRNDSTITSEDDITSSRCYVDNNEDMKIRINDLSRGLCEFQPSANVRIGAVFVHESVKDFLIESGGLSKLEGENSMNTRIFSSRAHVHLAWCCIRYFDICFT